MKGVILAGGLATRLYPISMSINKHLLPIYDKPMLNYPLSVMMMAGVREIMIITKNSDLQHFMNIYGDGRDLGIKITYEVQTKPNGIPEALLIAERFIDDDKVFLILGDNFLYGANINEVLQKGIESNKSACVFALQVNKPQNFGVVEFDGNENPIKILEKPKNPKSNYVIPGFYFYDNSVTKKVKKLTKSNRGEYEISSLNEYYLNNNELEIIKLGRGFTWLDTGTFEDLHIASDFVRTTQINNGYIIGCLEEIAYRKGYISKNDLRKLIKNSKLNGSLNDYLNNLLAE